jgi:hypothetical protein
MAERKDKPQPEVSAAGRAEAQAREARLAAALRENLKRRKDQMRARAGRAGEAGDGAESGASGQGDRDGRDPEPG